VSKKNKRDRNKPWGASGGFPNNNPFVGKAGSALSPAAVVANAGGSPLGKGAESNSLPDPAVAEATPPDGLASAPGSQVAAAAKELVAESATLEAPVESTSEETTTSASGQTEAAVAAPSLLTEELVELIRGTRQAREAFRSAEASAKRAAGAAELAREEAAAAKKECELRESALVTREADVAKRSADLETRHLELLKLEAAAREGFPDRLREAREGLQREISEREAALLDQQNLFAHERASLKAERLALQKDQAALSRQHDDLELRQELATHRDQLAEERAAKRVQAEFDALKAQIERSEIALKDRERRAELDKSRIGTLESLLASAGGVSLTDLTVERDALRKRVDSLELDLLKRPGQATIDQYKSSLARLDVVESENQQLRSERASQRAELERLRIAADAIGSQEDKKKSLESINRNYKEVNAELRAEIDARLTQAAGRNPFREMDRMDADHKLQVAPTNLHRPSDLKRLVSDLRNRMAASSPALFYGERTIRCFLAGLAMSRLQLLQGLSGTGKTSLPRALAAALGGRSDIAAVQAGWRDRQDLLGYYNEFDKKYHETDFVKALYRAQCPHWRDRVCIIILDEMNLSYVEQFGADLLSEMESPKEGGPRLSLLHFQHPQAPALLCDGMEIRLPDNVWFVGTANHDETTKDFADKTYDRSNAMELPRKPDTFTPTPGPVPPPSSCSALLKLFDDAQRDHLDGAQRAKEYVNSLEGELKGKFGIGWSNRFERQIDDFVPVVVGAGGTIGEAVDHLVASRLLRKLRNRHDVREGSLQGLRKALQSNWKSMDASRPPSQCFELLDELIRTRSFEEGETAS
jgi:hypothetical protein